jgi:hypothetical protein
MLKKSIYISLVQKLRSYTMKQKKHKLIVGTGSGVG